MLNMTSKSVSIVRGSKCVRVWIAHFVLVSS